MAVLYAVLLFPAILMAYGAVMASDPLDLLLIASGELSAKLLLLTLAITPLRLLFPASCWLAWLRRHRRALGVATFGYAGLHTLAYLIDMGELKYVFDEIGALGIWTGWAAVALFLPLALTSNNYAAGLLKRNWQHLHRITYLAAIFVLLHWVYIHNSAVAAWLYFIPLILLEMLRVKKIFFD